MLLLARRLVISCNGSWRGWQCLWRLCLFGLSEHRGICSHSCGRDAMGTYKSYHRVYTVPVRVAVAAAILDVARRENNYRNRLKIGYCMFSFVRIQVGLHEVHPADDNKPRTA